MASEAGSPVELYIYDLTNGLATVLSPAIIGNQDLLISDPSDLSELGRQVEGVWHTSVVVFEREYFFGGSGVTSCSPGGTQLGPPHRVERLGETFVPFQVFVDYIQGLATTTYTGSTYRLLEHNCNHFSDEVVQFLCGARVPKHIVQQPDVLPAPLRLALTALLDNLLPDAAQVYANGGVRHSRQESPEFATLNSQIEEARAAGARLEARRGALAEKLARKERKREKKRKKLQGGDGSDAAGDATEQECVMSEAAVSERAGPSAGALDDEVDLRRQDEMHRREKDPPVVYRDFDGCAELEALSAALEGVELSAEEQQSLEELRQYLGLGEGSWVLGDDFLAFIGRLLSDGNLSSAVRVCALRCLCACALREDVSLVLHQDRRHHALLNYAHRIDLLPAEEQLPLATFMCNLFENISSSEWLLYISEWEVDGHALSNIRTSVKVCVHALVGEADALRDVGTALLYNIATKEVKTVRFQTGKALRDLLPRKAKSKVFDEVCAELALAALHVLSARALPEPQLHRCCAALARLCAHAADVPQLVAMVGPDPAQFRGKSARVDEQIDLILKKVK